MISKQTKSMTEAALIILRYLKENNDFDQFVQLSEKGLPFSNNELKNLLNHLNGEKLLILGPSGEYHFDDIHIKGKLCARITIEGERFIDENDLSVKGVKLTEYLNSIISAINFLSYLFNTLMQIF